MRGPLNSSAPEAPERSRAPEERRIAWRLIQNVPRNVTPPGVTPTFIVGLGNAAPGEGAVAGFASEREPPAMVK